MKGGIPFQNSFTEAVDGIYCNADDMLLWSHATLPALNGSISVLEVVKYMLSTHIAIYGPFLRERSDGIGWARIQLPRVIGVIGDNPSILRLDDLPELDRDSPSMLTVYHQGATTEYDSSLFLRLSLLLPFSPKSSPYAMPLI